MVEIITENVARSADELLSLTRKLEYLMESAEQVERSLSEYSWADGVRQQISGNRRKLDDERRSMISFAMVTEKIAAAYKTTETKIYGNSEGEARNISSGKLSIKSKPLFSGHLIKPVKVNIRY